MESKVYGGDDSPEGKQRRLELGVDRGVAAANRFAGRPVGDHVLRPLFGAIRLRYGLAVLEPVQQAGAWAVHGDVQRMTKRSDATVSEGPKRGDHVFALGVGKSIKDMHRDGSEAFEN